MKSLHALALSALVFSGTSFAWTWRWTDADDKTHIEFGRDDQNCTKIAMPKGAEYNWDPEGSFYCVHTFADSKCQDRNGWSCNEWKDRKLGQPWVRAYEVNTIDGYGNRRPEPETTTSSQTEEPTETTSQSTSTSTRSTTSNPSNTDTATNTPTPTKSPEDSSRGSSLSGGAIAGIVVGVCAGVGVMALFGFLAYRRRRSARNAHGDAPPPPPKNTYPELDSAAEASPVTQPPPPMSAVSAQPPVSELSAEAAAAPAYTPEKRAPSTVPYMTAKTRMAELPDTSTENKDSKDWHY